MMRATVASLPSQTVVVRPSAGTGGAAPAGGGIVLDSTTLLQGERSVTICHNGEFYRLQATRQGKLILTK